MEITAANLSIFFTGANLVFQRAFVGAKPTWDKIAMTTKSSTAVEAYPWMKQTPQIREWIGERNLQALETTSFTVLNRDWESTIQIDRKALEDDTYGLYEPMLALLGRSVAFHPDVMIYGMLKSAVANIDSPSSSSTFFNINFPAPVCYDGVTLLSANGHPVGPQGNTTLVANCNNGGSGPFWFLIDASRPVRPVMFQIRKPFEAVHMSMPTDEYVFNNRQYRFGVDGRDAAAPGFWQFIYASNQDLNNPSNYEAARSAMRAIKGDDGLPMFVWDDSAEERYLVVPTTLEGPARRLLHNEFGPGGGDFDASTPSTNIWKNDAKLIVTPLLN